MWYIIIDIVLKFKVYSNAIGICYSINLRPYLFNLIALIKDYLYRTFHAFPEDLEVLRNAEKILLMTPLVAKKVKVMTVIKNGFQDRKKWENATK